MEPYNSEGITVLWASFRITMEFFYYYFIISISLGISSLFGVFNPALKIARSIKDDIYVDNSPIISRIVWVIIISLIAPIFLYYLVTLQGELIELFAAGLLEKS